VDIQGYSITIMFSKSLCFDNLSAICIRARSEHCDMKSRVVGRPGKRWVQDKSILEPRVIRDGCGFRLCDGSYVPIVLALKDPATSNPASFQTFPIQPPIRRNS